MTKSLLVFPNGNTFDVPNRDRDFRGITDVYVGTIDEIPNVVRYFRPSGQTYLSKQIQQVLLKAIRDGAGKLTSAERSLWQAPGLENRPSGQALQLKGCVTASALNVRVGPSADYRITSSLEKGECALLSGRNEKGSWGKTSTGWVALNYIQMDGEVMDLPIVKP